MIKADVNPTLLPQFTWSKGMARARWRSLFYARGTYRCSLSEVQEIQSRVSASFVSCPAILSLGRNSSQGQDAWCCRNIDRLKSKTLLMALDHALSMVIPYKSSSVVCPLVGVLAHDSESKRKANEVMIQSVSYALSNIDRQMLLSLCTWEERQALFRTLTPHTRRRSELIFTRMSFGHLILFSRICNRPRGNKAKLRCQRSIAASCLSRSLPRFEQTESKE